MSKLCVKGKLTFEIEVDGRLGGGIDAAQPAEDNADEEEGAAKRPQATQCPFFLHRYLVCLEVAKLGIRILPI